MSVSVHGGELVLFSSTISGGHTPFSYQWCVNGYPVSGASSNTWSFSPSASGAQYVYLNVTDVYGQIALLETADVNVQSVPVGGYSVSFSKHIPSSYSAGYPTLMVLCGPVLTLII